jgi:hypothetical protein
LTVSQPGTLKMLKRMLAGIRAIPVLQAKPGNTGLCHPVRLFDLAERHNARVVAVGDVQQPGAIEAEAAFSQEECALEHPRRSAICKATGSILSASIEQPDSCLASHANRRRVCRIGPITRAPSPLRRYRPVFG